MSAGSDTNRQANRQDLVQCHTPASALAIFSFSRSFAVTHSWHACAQAQRNRVHADFVFMGSFGVGGKKVGANGSVTDYLMRYIDTTVVSD